MPFYDVQCLKCEKQLEQVLPMPKFGTPPKYDPCEHCQGEVKRLYTPPADHSDNTFRPRWSDNLSESGDPVYVATKDQYRHLKAKFGLTEHEKGMSEDRKRWDREKRQKDAERAFNTMFGGLAP